MSAFSGHYGKGAMAQHRDAKHVEAMERQLAFDYEVRVCAHDHNISEREARRVVNSERRLNHYKARRTNRSAVTR